MSVVATLLVRVAANLTELDKSFSELERGADRIAKAYTKLGGQLQGIGSKLTTGLTLPIAGLGAAATSSFAQFDTALKGVQAAIQPTKAEMLALEAAAMEWGAKTQYSATEAATALGELGKAGVKTADSIELLPSVLNLATVGGMDLASAAGLTTDTLTQFGLKANKASKVNDVLAKSAQVSTTSVAELGNALKYAGPVAGAFGMSIEETGAALALFANAGIKSDMAGTALRGILTEIKTPAKGLSDVMKELGISTLASADGTVHLVDVMKKLEDRGASSEQIMRAFGDRAGPALVGAMQQGSTALQGLNEDMRKSDGTAKAVAETLMSGLGGALEKMRGAVETAGIALGKVLAPAITYAADLIASLAEFVSGTLVPAFEKLPTAAKVAAGGILGMAAAIGPLVYVSGTLIQSFGAMAGLFAKTAGGAATVAGASATVTRSFTLQAAATWIATAATNALNASMLILASPITWTIAAAAALVIGLRYLTGSWEGVLRVLTQGRVDFQTLETLWKDLKTAGEAFTETIGTIGREFSDAARIIGDTFVPVLDDIKRFATEAGGLLRDPLTLAISSLTGASTTAADTGLAKLIAALSQIKTFLTEIPRSPLEGLITSMQAIGSSAHYVAGKYREFQNEQYKVYKLTVEGEAAWKLWNTGLTEVGYTVDTTGIKLGDFGGTMMDVLSTAGRLMPRLAPVAPVIRGTGDAAAKAAADAKKLRDEMWALYDQMSGQDTIKNAFKLMNALVDMRSKGFEPTAKAALEIREAFEDLTVELKKRSIKVSDYMTDLYDSLKPPANLFDQLRGLGSALAYAIRNQVPQIAPAMQGSINSVLAGITWEGFGEGLEAYLRGNAMKAAIAEWGHGLSNEINKTMADMFTGQTGFMDGFRSMFAGVQNFAGEVIGAFGTELRKGIGDLMAGGDFNIKELFGGDKNLAAGAAAGAAVGMAVGVAFGRTFGKVTGMAMGAVSGALAGGMYGGWAGAAIGAGVGAVSAWFSATAEEKKQRAAMQQARQEMRMTFGTMDEMQATAKRLGVSWDALWETKDLIRFQGALAHLNQGLAEEKRLLDDLAKGLDKTAESGALLSKELIKAMDTKLPGGTEAIAAFMQSQFSAASAGLDAFLTNTTLKTEAGAAAISASLAAMYQQMVAGGMAPSAAFAALEPAIAKLQKQLTDAGFAGSEAFAPLAGLAQLSADAIAGPMFDAMAGLEQGLTATFNMGLLNKEAFAGFAAELLAGYKTLEAQGKGGVTAMAGMQGALQKVWELSEDFGYSLEGGEAQLIDYAESAGLVGDKFRPATDRMVNAIDALIDRFDQFLARLTESMPAAAAAGANAVQQAFKGLEMPTVEIPTRVLPPDNMPQGGYYSPGAGPQYIPALGGGGIVTKPTVALIGESGPEAVVPLASAFAAETDLTVYLDSEVITRAVLRKQPRQLRVYGAVR